jgi:hypothetical protein
VWTFERADIGYIFYTCRRESMLCVYVSVGACDKDWTEELDADRLNAKQNKVGTKDKNKRKKEKKKKPRANVG